MREIFLALVISTVLVASGCVSQDMTEYPVTLPNSEQNRNINTAYSVNNNELLDPVIEPEISSKIAFTFSDKRLLWSGGYADPSVIKKNDGTYLMYLNTFGSSGIGTLAYSSNDGIEWKKQTDIIFSGVAQGRAYKLANGIRFYYHQQGPEHPMNTQASLISSFSSDGLSFKKDSGIRVETTEGIILEGPSIIQLKDGTYRMFYDEYEMSSGMEKRAKIRGAVSEDGLAWHPDESYTITADEIEGTSGDWPQVLHPSVIEWNNGYIMFYNSHSRVYAAYSDDTFEWEKLGYTGLYGADVDAIQLDDGDYRIYYGDFSPETSGVVYTAALEITE